MERVFVYADWRVQSEGGDRYTISTETTEVSSGPVESTFDVWKCGSVHVSLNKNWNAELRGCNRLGSSESVADARIAQAVCRDSHDFGEFRRGTFKAKRGGELSMTVVVANPAKMHFRRVSDSFVVSAPFRGEFTGGESPTPGAQQSAGVQPTAELEASADLKKADIIDGMSHVKERVAQCYDRFQQAGLAAVTVTIDPGGKTADATVMGSFKGTPTGDCVREAVLAATFKRFKGAPKVINYPFLLR